MAKIGLNVAVGANISEFSTKMQNVQRTLKQNQKVIKQYAAAVGTIVTTIGVASIKAAADMEVMKNRLLVAFNGSEAAASKALSEINKFTATTPFQLEEVADGFLKLKNLGLDPSIDSLRSYGNTASAMGKSLNQMIEAVADASVGEFERLKEFGIKAKSEGDKVSFTFQGVTTTVRKNSEEIQKYLLDIGNVNFAGSTQKQSETLTGQLSTLNDNVKILASSFGELLLPAVKELVRESTTLVGEFQKMVGFRQLFGKGKGPDMTAEYERYYNRYNDLLEMQRRGVSPFVWSRGSLRLISNELEYVSWQMSKLDKQEKTFKGRDGRSRLGASGLATTTKPVQTPLTGTATKLASEGPVGEMVGFAMSADIFSSKITKNLTKLPKVLMEVQREFIHLGRVIDENVTRQIESMNVMLESFIEDTIADLASALGDALVGGDGFKNFGREALGNLANYLSQFGKMLIVYGVGLEAIEKAITNPALAIAAGVALIATSAAIKGHLSKSSSAMTGGASSSGVASGGGTLTAVIRGGDLYLMTEEYSKRRK